MAAGLRAKSFDIRVVNGWDELPEGLAEVGSKHEFKGRLDSAWLSVFGEGGV